MPWCQVDSSLQCEKDQHAWKALPRRKLEKQDGWLSLPILQNCYRERWKQVIKICRNIDRKKIRGVICFYEANPDVLDPSVALQRLHLRCNLNLNRRLPQLQAKGNKKIRIYTLILRDIKTIHRSTRGNQISSININDNSLPWYFLIHAPCTTHAHIIHSSTSR